MHHDGAVELDGLILGYADLGQRGADRRQASDRHRAFEASVVPSGRPPAAMADDGGADAGQGVADERADVACAQCGVVESMREIVEFLDDLDRGVAVATRRGGLAAPPTSIKEVEVTVRMKDGVSHLFRAANAANWRAGERVIFIAS